VPCTKSKFQVEQSLPQFYGFNCRAREAAVDFGGCVYGRRQPELLAVIFAGEANAATLYQAPQASDDETRILVEHNHPVVLATGERFEAMSDEPRKLIHQRSRLS
jgi:hypothetical protein